MALHDKVGRRLRAARLRELPNRDTELFSLVGKIVLDAAAGEDDDSNWQNRQQGIVAFERRRHGMLGPVGTEGDLRDLAGVGSGGGDALGAFGRTAV